MKTILITLLMISAMSFAGNKKNHKNKTTVKHKNGKTIVKNLHKHGDKKTIKKLVINHKKRKIKFIKKKNILDGNPLNSPVKEKYARFEIILPEKIELDKAFYKIKGQKREKIELTKLEDLKYEAKIPVSHLAPGEYDIKFTVFDEKSVKHKIKGWWNKKFKRYKAAFAWFGFIIDDSLEVPEPPKSIAETLEGQDLDNDGLVDSVQRLINEVYADNEPLKKNFKEYFRKQHFYILNRSDRVLAKNWIQIQSDKSECLDFFFNRDIKLASKKTDEIMDTYLNSRVRLKAYTELNVNASGGTSVLGEYGEEQDKCI